MKTRSNINGNRNYGKYEFSDVNDETKEFDGVEVTSRQLILDFKMCEGFYVHDKEELNEMGNMMIRADIVMENLDQDKINGIIEIGKRKYKDVGIEELRITAGSMALMTLLALQRLTYLLDEREE